MPRQHIRPEDWTWTHHALQRAVEMALDAEELRRALEQRTRPLPSRRYPGCHLIYTARIVLAVNLDDRAVITVLWNTWNGNDYRRFDRDDIEMCRDKPRP
jgi:hypothetical protein